ncbi:hypothetical protein AFK24_20320 [Pseudomonas syringae]|uniref:Uncharacterized protein n=1 Tax=Pseudomonas syringae TaxID=317 RepID=A0A1C7YZV3_PSESX|nr:hypothetical protein [Pseudomonas syringae]OCR23191.1 hypothetical protein AFK24_20320 [Pseudomonas syringae]
MTASLAATATAALPASGGPGGVQASQNLFEHMAGNAKGMPEGASPHQIGDGLMERLNGFIDRSRSFSERADVLTNGPTPGAAPPAASAQPSAAPQAASANGASSGQPPKKVGEQQVDQIVHSLGKMFDYSIETQMVVRGATQISGSANTLLKGQ